MTACQVKADGAVTDSNTATMPVAIWNAAQLGTMSGSRVRLSVGSAKDYLVPVIRPGAAGNEVWVANRILGLRVNNPAEPAQLEPVPDSEYRKYLLFGTRDGILAVVGLIVAVVGLLIQTFNTLSDAASIADIGKPTRGFVGAFGILLQIAGLGLVFWRGVLSGKLP